MKNLEKFKIPSKIDFVESLPKTDYGKVKPFYAKITIDSWLIQIVLRQTRENRWIITATRELLEESKLE